MAAAVLIQTPDEGIVYANQAAAEAFGLPDAEAVRLAAPEQIAESWESYDEDGRPLTSDRYPSRRILNGTELHPEPLVTRGIELNTGRETWVRVKATPVFAPDGSVAMAVSVSEDITSIKHAELLQAQLHAEQAHTAAVLQRSLLPRALPEIPGLALAATYRPAGEHVWVGGDFYDAFETAGGWMAIVGDITGQGVEAAALTSQARHVLRSNAMFTGDIAEALTHLNRLLLDEDELSLCTVCGVQFTVADSAMTAQIVCAGHPRPILVRDGSTGEVGEWGRLVGAFADSAFAATELALLPGDLLVLYTDGLTDARGPDERFGSERLLRVLSGAGSAQQAIELLEAELDRFQSGPQADDTAILAIELSA